MGSGALAVPKTGVSKEMEEEAYRGFCAGGGGGEDDRTVVLKLWGTIRGKFV